MAEKNVVRQDVVQIIWESDMALLNTVTSQMDKLTGNLADVGKGFRGVTAGADFAGDAVKDLVKQGRGLSKMPVSDAADDFGGLTRNAGKSEKAVREVAAAGRKLKSMGADAAARDFKKLESGAGSAEKSVKALDRLKLSGLTRGLETAYNKMDGLAKKAGEVNGKLKEKFKSAGGDFLAAAGITMGVGAAVKSGVDYQQSVNQLQARTGASDKEMKALSGTIRELYADNMGEDFSDVANSVATVRSITGQSGEALKSLTHNALSFRDTFEFDVNESVRAADMMMRQFGVSGDQAYSLIAQGAQQGLDKNGDLLDTVNEYSVHFKQLGFSAEEMMNMMASGAKSGTFSVDKLGDTLKEFGIRSKDGSKSTQEAFAALGLNAAKLSDDFAHGGAAGKKAFMAVTQKLAAMKDPLQQDAVGVALFGTMWEDLQAQGVFALTKLNGNIKGTTDALDKINEVRYNDLGSALGALGRTFTTEIILPLTTGLSQDFSNAVNTAKQYIQDFGVGLRGEGSAIGTVWGQVGLLFRAVGGTIGAVLGFAVRHANILVPAIMAIVIAMTVWKVVSAAVAFAEKTRAIVAAIAAGKTIFAAGAQWLMNTAMYACPALWLVGVLLIVVAVIGLVVWGLSKLIGMFTGANDAAKDFGGGIGDLTNSLDAFSGKDVSMNMGVEGDPAAQLQQNIDGMQGTGVDIPANMTPEMGNMDLSGYEMPVTMTAEDDSKNLAGKFADNSGFNDSWEPKDYMKQPEAQVRQMTQVPTQQAAPATQAEDAGLDGYSPGTSTNETNNYSSTDSRRNESFTYSPTVNVTVHGSGDDAKQEERVKVQVKKVLREEFETFRRKHGRLIEA